MVPATFQECCLYVPPQMLGTHVLIRGEVPVRIDCIGLSDQFAVKPQSVYVDHSFGMQR